MKILYLFRILLAIASLSLSITCSIWVSAQNDNDLSELDNVHLWVYPEYDDPRLLVMLQGQIVDIQAPTTIRFLVPSAAEMYSAGAIDDQGHYSGSPPHREPSDIQGWDEISYELTSDNFRVEYYDPIILGFPDKTISYEFISLYQIANLHVIIQEPKQSVDFNVSIEGEVSSDDQGFTNHIFEYQKLNSESPIKFKISYIKSNTLPSLSIEDDEPKNTMLIVTTIVGLIIILAIGLFWVLKSKPKNRAERKRMNRNKKVKESNDKGNGYSKFCSQCGKSIDATSLYCQFCGTKLLKQ